MKISGYNSIDSTRTIKKRGEATQAGAFFDILAAAEAEETTSASPLSDVTAPALGNLLTLQEVPEEEIRRRKLAQQGKSLIDVLEQLRQRLLTGTLPMALIRDLNNQISVKKQFVEDSHLNEIIEDIELRAAVELAKLERAAIR